MINYVSLCGATCTSLS